MLEQKHWKDKSIDEINDYVSRLFKQADSDCSVQRLRTFMDGIRKASCGECVICREGTLQLYVVADAVSQGIGRIDDIEVVAEVSKDLAIGSACDYGKIAGKQACSLLEEGMEQLERHIKRKRCDARVCEKLSNFAEPATQGEGLMAGRKRRRRSE